MKGAATRLDVCVSVSCKQCITVATGVRLHKLNYVPHPALHTALLLKLKLNWLLLLLLLLLCPCIADGTGRLPLQARTRSVPTVGIQWGNAGWHAR
jgi:hypothetical protein